MMSPRRASGRAASDTPERFMYSASYNKVIVIYRGTEPPMAQTIAIERVDHIGIRVRDLDRALAFYRVLGFALAHRAPGGRCRNRSRRASAAARLRASGGSG